MSNSISNKIPIIIIILLVICLFLNHSIKKNAFADAVDEELIKNIMVGTYAPVSGYGFENIICTKDNIIDITITNKLVSMYIYTNIVLVDFEITLECNGQIVSTTGNVVLEYDKNEKTKWVISSRTLDNKNAILYG